jgi:hypothetical protein
MRDAIQDVCIKEVEWLLLGVYKKLFHYRKSFEIVKARNFQTVNFWVVLHFRWIPTLQRNMLPASSGAKGRLFPLRFLFIPPVGPY